MSYIRCHACRGQKKIKGLGCMLKKCLECEGTGYVEQDDESIAEVIEQDNEVIEEAQDETVEQETVEEQVAKTESSVKAKTKSRWVKKDK